LQDDLPGYVPDLEPPALTIGGYVDIGFADAAGNGTSFHPDDRRLPLDYGSDSFATAVNSRGDVASREAGGRFTNAFLPRTAGIGGRPSFLLNTVDVDLQHAPRDSALLVFVRLQFLPRLTARGSETRVVVEQAFGRLQPLRDHELMLFVGRVDSVFGIEYLENQAPLRTGVTPSLIARYTTGTTLGGKLLYRLQLAPLRSAVSLNVAATNNAPFSDALQAAEASLPGRPGAERARRVRAEPARLPVEAGRQRAARPAQRPGGSGGAATWMGRRSAGLRAGDQLQRGSTCTSIRIRAPAPS
jgi:hypothetical protein